MGRNCAVGGALEFCRRAESKAKSACWASPAISVLWRPRSRQSGLVDMLMIRYNAAHRGAETEIFPVTQSAGHADRRLHESALGRTYAAHAGRSAGICCAGAPDWYRFVLQQPAATVCAVGALFARRVG